MTTHVACYELRFARDAAQGALPTSFAWTTRVQAAMTNGVGESDSANLSPGLIPPSAWNALGAPGPLQAVAGVLVGDAANLRIATERSALSWAIEGAFTANVVAGITFNPDAAFGRQAPPMRLHFEGNAHTAITAGPNVPQNVQVVCHWAYTTQSYQTLTHAIDFEERPPNTNLDGSDRLLSLIQEIDGAGQGRRLIGVTGAGVELFVNSCGWTGNLPEGRVFCRPEDIGDGPDLIPGNNDGDLNTAAKFRAHPGVFVRRTSYVRSVARQNVDNTAITVTAGDQPFRITTITTAPTSSDWLISVDGVMMVVRLLHPAMSDLRRPRDIWNSIWVPAITGGGAPNLSLIVAGTDGTQVTAYAALTRLSYLEYARCLSIAGTEVDISQVPA